MKKILIFDPSTWASATGGTSYLRNISKGLIKHADCFNFIFFCNSRARDHVDEQLGKHFEVKYSDCRTGLLGAVSRKRNMLKAVNYIRPDLVLSMNQCDAVVDVPVITFLRNRLYFETNSSWFRKL